MNLNNYIKSGKDEEISLMFDDLKRSTAIFKLAMWKKNGVLSGEDFEELLKIADESLYDAKRSGRGRIGSIRKKRIDLPTQVCVGRRWEKEALKRFITKDDEGVRAAIIEGNVGVGKTRLVREVLNTVSGMEILWSDCLAFFESIPYYPISEIIRYKMKRQGRRRWRWLVPVRPAWPVPTTWFGKDIR